MEKETAQQLLQMIVDTATIGIGSQTRLLALEKTMKEHDPTLYQKYETELLRQGQTASLNPAAISALLEKLTQH